MDTYRAFIEFLATLGLRTYEGEDKLAYKELKRQDGVLDPDNISSLILADPAAVHNKKQGIRTVWKSDFIF